MSQEEPVTYKKQRPSEIMAYIRHVDFGKEQCVAPKASPKARIQCVQVADELEGKTGVG